MPADRRLQAITGRMFRLLAEVDDRGNYKRRWTSRREILEVCADRAATPEEIDGIIAAFSSPYPFLNARPGLDGKIDVSHESFIRDWTQFTDWLKHERQLAVAYDMLRRKYLARQHALVERAKSPGRSSGSGPPMACDGTNWSSSRSGATGAAKMPPGPIAISTASRERTLNWTAEALTTIRPRHSIVTCCASINGPCSSATRRPPGGG